MKAVSVDELW